MINSPVVVDADSDDEEFERPNLKPETKMTKKSFDDTKIFHQNMKNFYLEKSDEVGVPLSVDLKMHNKGLMSQFSFKTNCYNIFPSYDGTEILCYFLKFILFHKIYLNPIFYNFSTSF